MNNNNNNNNNNILFCTELITVESEAQQNEQSIQRNKTYLRLSLA